MVGPLSRRGLPDQPANLAPQVIGQDRPASAALRSASPVLARIDAGRSHVPASDVSFPALQFGHAAVDPVVAGELRTGPRECCPRLSQLHIVAISQTPRGCALRVWSGADW